MTTACSGTVWWQRWTGLESIPCVWLSLAFPDLLKILSDSFLWNLSRYAYWHILQTTCSEDFFFWGGGVIYGGHPSALLSSRQCHELRPTFPYADLKHFGLPSSPDSSAFFLKVCRTSESHPSLPPPTPVMRFELRFGQLAIPSVETGSCHLVHLQNTGCVTPSAILQMRFSHPAMICFALLLKPCPLLQHNNREIMVFARRQHSNSGQPRELWYELVGARMHCMNNCMPSQAAYIAVGVQSSQYTCLI